MSNQKGFTLFSFLVIVFLVATSIYLIKLVPHYMQAMTINQVFQQVVSMPDAASMSDKELLDSYSRRSSIDAVTAITLNDIYIEKEDGHVTLSAQYEKNEKLFGNISVVLSFNPSARK